MPSRSSATESFNFEFWEAYYYHIVRLLYQIVLVGNSFEVSGELLLLRVEGFFLGLLTLMHEHQIVDDVDVGDDENDEEEGGEGEGEENG